MKNLFTLIFILISIFVFSQEKKVSFSVEGKIGRTDEFFYLRRGYSLSFSPPSSIIVLNEGTLSFGIGGLVKLPLSDRFNFQTGLNSIIFRKKSSKDYRSLSTGYYSDIYLELPIRLNFQIFKKTKAYQFSISQSPIFNVFNTYRSTSSTIEYNRKLEIRESFLQERKFNLNTQFGFIWIRDLNKGNNFYIFPNVQFQTLSRIKKDLLPKRGYALFEITGGLSI